MIHSHIMSQYIDEQGSVLQNLLVTSQFEEIQLQLTKPIHKIIIVGTGSSYNMALAASKDFERLLSTTCVAFKPSDFVIPDDLDTLIIFISQTGTSNNVLNIVNKTKSFQTIAVTEDLNSPLAQQCDITIDILTGKELCNAKTKGVTATYCALLILAHTLSETSFDYLQNEIDTIPQVIEETKQLASTIDINKVDHTIYIGDPHFRAVGLEGSLKYLEVLLDPALYCDIDEFSHGYHRLINPNSLGILIQRESDEEFNQATKKLFNQLIVLDPSNSLIINTIIVHTLISEWAKVRQIDPNQPIHEWFNVAVKTRD